MSLIGWIFGGRDSGPTWRLEQEVELCIRKDRHLIHRVADTVALGPGRYRIDLSEQDCAYSPVEAWTEREGSWRHALHMLTYAAVAPLSPRASPPATPPRHRIIVNRADPGPHASKYGARQAARAIPESERLLDLAGPARLVLWIDMDRPGARGSLRVRIMRWH